MNMRIRRPAISSIGLALLVPAWIAIGTAAQLKPVAQKTPVALDKVSVHGHVKLPDGRPLQGAVLTLSSGGQGPISLTDTANSSGFYAFSLEKGLIGRTFQLSPAFPGRPGASFNPGQRIFGLTASPGPLDFTYQGPLPDLSCPQANIFFEMEGQSRHYYIQVTVLNGINNGQGLSCGPFKVRATYEDRTVNPWKTREAVFPVAGLDMGLTYVEKHISIGVYPPQAFFRLIKVEVDIEDAVFEGNEGNNAKIFN
jgi:hypothetical protein